jgi:hypothetical protein
MKNIRAIVYRVAQAAFVVVSIAVASGANNSW